MVCFLKTHKQLIKSLIPNRSFVKDTLRYPLSHYDTCIFNMSSPRVEPSLQAWSEGLDYLDLANVATDSIIYKNFGQKLNVFFGSWKHYNTYSHRLKRIIVSQEIPYICIETSLLGRQKVGEAFTENWFRIGINGFLADTGLFNNFNKPSDRWNMIKDMRNIHLEDWQPGNEYILLALQLPGDASLRGADISKWAYDVCHEIRKMTDFKIKIRKPQLPRDYDDHYLKKIVNLKNVEIENGTYENLLPSLKKAKFTCTYTSGLGIDSILSGIPVVVYNKGSFVYNLRTDLEQAVHNNFNLPDRNQLLYNLAYCQWNLDEIKLGLPQKHLD